MSQSLNKVLVHSVFSTKYRQHLIDKNIESELHSYLGGICKNLECPPFQVGGYTDHVHILCGLSKKISIMDFMEEVKTRSSRWIKTKGDQYSNFRWQGGYGIFSINPQDRWRVINYIKNQRQHHTKISYQNECRALYKQFHVDYDERYVWD